MCTKAEAEEAVRNVLEEKVDGQTVIEREMEIAGDRIIRKITFRFGIPLIIAIISGCGMWFNLQYRVANIESKMSEGGRYTQEEHDTYAEEQKRINDAQNKVIDDFRVDVKEQLGQMNSKLDTHTSLLYQIAREK